MFDIVPFFCVNTSMHSSFLVPVLSIPSHLKATSPLDSLAGGAPQQDESTRPVLRLV